MKLINFFTLILFFWGLSFELWAYVHSRGVNGAVVHWNEGTTQVRLYVKTSNRQNINSDKIWNIVVAATDEWNNVSALKILPILNTGSIIPGESNLYFASGSSSIFSGMGAGILGVTQVMYDAQGKVVGGDVIINDSPTLEVDTINTNNYLGNIVTHELGHLLGLSHTEVKDATMIYTALKGQVTLASDDKAGIHSLYPISTKGTIRGKVIGGDDFIGILGTHVQAISRQTGKVKAGSYSEVDGSFAIEGLDLDESYYLYLAPPSMLAQVPDYYSEAKKNFCSSNAAYRGSFFESCRAQEAGFPQELELTSSSPSIDVGLVTIRCDLATPVDYLSHKPFVANDYVLFSDEGKSFTGFFTSAEISQGTKDIFQIDLRSHVVIGTEFLSINTLSQAFYSRLVFKVQVKVLDGTDTVYSYSPSFDLDSLLTLDYNLRIPLNSISSKNIFEVTLIPVSSTHDFYNREQWNWGSGIYGLSDLFPNYSVMNEDLHFYFFIYGISRLAGNGSYIFNNSSNYYFGDNTSCPDGPRTYKVAATADSDAFSTRRNNKKLDQESPLGCGTIDSPGGGGGSGPLLVILGILITFLVRLFPSTKRPWIMARPIS